MHKSPFGQLLEQRHTINESQGEWQELSRASQLDFAARAHRDSITMDAQAREQAARHLPSIELVDYAQVKSDLARQAEGSQKPAGAFEKVETAVAERGPEPGFERDRDTKWYGVSAQRPLFSPEGNLITRQLPDGTEKTEQAHPDGSVRSLSRFPDGNVQERIADRYGRPFYTCDIKPDGTYTVTELQYQDTPGRISPFTSGRRVITSDGLVRELKYDKMGRVASKHEYEQVRV